MASEPEFVDSKNVSWLNNKGSWLAYILLVLGLHFFLMTVPLISVPTVWTLTNVLHSVLSYIALHYVKGTPYISVDQGATGKLTHWEQMETEEDSLSTTRKFLIVMPAVLFILASFYTEYNFTHFIVNLVALAIAVVPKFPVFHRFRPFRINKY